jgi:hypothetical protein
MRNVVIVFLAILLAGPLPGQSGESRGLNAAVQQLAGQAAAVGTQYAVLIAINRYRDWNALRHPVEDAREIHEILSRRYFVDRFIELYDDAATKEGIIRLFNQLISTTRPEDGVFIFYAGHGHLDPMSDTGFWIPADGGLDRFAQDNWLPNSQVRGFISKMKPRHVVLMSDSCFSGDILNPTRAITPEITSEYFRKAYSRVSRQVLTSGASEAVPDSSEFARGLKLALEGNMAPQLDPLMLYNQVRLGMKRTTPLFGDLKDSGHQDGASFLFFLRQEPGQPPPGEGTANTDTPFSEETPVVGELVAAAADAVPVNPTFTVERQEGTIVVRAVAGGVFMIDGKQMGSIPDSGTARLEKLPAGAYVLSMRFESGEEEVQTISLKGNQTTTLTFGETLRGGEAVPTTTIRIDGNFEDWKNVRPVFVKDPPGKDEKDLSLKISKVYLAIDSEYLYMRFDIADPAKPTLLRPYNFSEANVTEYKVYIGEGPNNMSLDVHFERATKGGRGGWSVYVAQHGGNFKRLGQGEHQKKGSSLEARFPLTLVRTLIKDGVLYKVVAEVIYAYDTSTSNWKWRRADWTETRQFSF